MFIVRANVNRRTSSYSDILRAIEQKDDLYDPSSPLQLSPQEKSVILSALDGPVYSRTRVCKTPLLRLDTLLADRGARYEHATVTIEHVLPRNPERNSQWLRNFPDEEERTEWTDRLANLVLLSRTKNSSAQNYDFDRKKREYFQRRRVVTFALTSQVLAESEWTPKVLERRQGKLIDVLKKEWRLEGATPSRPVHNSREQVKPAYNVEVIRREHPRAYAKWSSEDDERLKEMYAAGKNVAELAKHFERKRGAIESRLKKLSLDQGVAASSTYEKTRSLLEQGMTVEQVARERGLAKKTITEHLERLIKAGLDIDLRPMLPPPERFEEIRRAFKETGSNLLSPVKELLGDDYAYDEIRMVQIFLRSHEELTG